MTRYFITSSAWLGRRLDALGMSLSGLCAVHCLAMPALLSSGLVLADHGRAGDPTHLVLFGLAGPISAFALWRSYREHRAWLPLLFGGAGVVLLWFGLTQGGDGPLARNLTLTGAGMLAAMHLYNWRRHTQRHAHIGSR